MPVTHVVASVLTVNICQTCCLLEQRLTPADDTLCHVLQFMLVSGYFSLLGGGGGGGQLLGHFMPVSDKVSLETAADKLVFSCTWTVLG